MSGLELPPNDETSKAVRKFVHEKIASRGTPPSVGETARSLVLQGAITETAFRHLHDLRARFLEPEKGRPAVRTTHSCDRVRALSRAENGDALDPGIRGKDAAEAQAILRGAGLGGPFRSTTG